MKAITIWQPYASLLALGIKTVETRGWYTSYRGPIAIHAAKRFDSAVADDCRRAVDFMKCQVLKSGSVEAAFPWFTEQQRELADTPFGETIGHVVGIGALCGCVKEAEPPSEADAEFGWFGADRFSWELEKVRAIKPVAVTGKQGLWNWDFGE